MSVDSLANQDVEFFFFWFCVIAERGMGHSEETRLANLLRRVSREDDRDRRLASLKQLKEFISHGESKVVSKIIYKKIFSDQTKKNMVTLIVKE